MNEETLASSFSTPHDAFLEQFNRNDASALTASQQRSSRPLFPGLAPPPEPLDTVYDPFDGSVLGTLVKPDHILHPEAHALLSDPNNEELWIPLSKVLDLQGQVAHLHAEMEGIGTKAGDYAKGKNKGRMASKKWVQSDTEEDEGVDVKTEADEEEKQNREREQEFARLADQFEGRKQGIKEMMNKLDDLSKALTEFHALQAPNLDFPPPSRNNSMPLNSPTLSPAMSPTSPFDLEPLYASLPNASRSYSGPLPSSSPSPALLINSVEPGRQAFAVESPVSAEKPSPPP